MSIAASVDRRDPSSSEHIHLLELKLLRFLSGLTYEAPSIFFLCAT
jgi:hypothetical protein